jgi:hypothetical protein
VRASRFGFRFAISRPSSVRLNDFCADSMQERRVRSGAVPGGRVRERALPARRLRLAPRLGH